MDVSRRHFQPLWVGDHFVFGRTNQGYGIWEKATASRRRRPGSPIQTFPATEEGWEAAWRQFSAWEPSARRWSQGQEGPSSGQPAEVGSREGRPWWHWAVPALAVVIGGATAGLVVMPSKNRPVHLTTAAGGSLRPAPGSPPGTAGTDAAGSGPSEGAPAVGNGYLADGSGYVAFIQWTDDDGRLTGTAQEVATAGTPPNLHTTSQTLSLVGSLNASTLSLSFDGSPATFGTLTDGAFTLNFPQSDGSLAPVTFSQAAADQFNNALRDLQTRVATADQTEADAEALQQAQRKIGQDAASLASALGALPQAEQDLSSAVGAIPDALQTEVGAIAQTHTEDEQVAREAGQGAESGQVCSDAGTTSSDAGTVSSDAATVASDGASVESSIASLNSDVSEAKGGLAQLRQDEAALPGYSPAGAPSQQDVDSAVGKTAGAISTAIGTTNTYIDQANAGVTTAFAYAAEAFKTGNCGQAPSAPSPNGHIGG